jgi:hypothetical protein
MYVLQCSEGWAIVAPSAEALGQAITQAERRDLDFGFTFDTWPIDTQQWLDLCQQADQMSVGEIATVEQARKAEAERLNALQS